MKWGNTIHGELYKFTDSGLYYQISPSVWRLDEDTTLLDIIKGNYVVVKLPFKPKNDNNYYAVSWDKTNDTSPTVSCHTWVGDTFDYAFYYCGNCFRTEVEAEAHKEEIIAKLKGKYEGD